MVNSGWLWVIAAICLIGGFLAGIVYAAALIEFRRIKAEAEDRRKECGAIEGAWHFGYIRQYRKSETKTSVEFRDGLKVDVDGILPYDFRPGEFARLYYGCKKNGNSQTALSDFVAN